MSKRDKFTRLLKCEQTPEVRKELRRIARFWADTSRRIPVEKVENSPTYIQKRKVEKEKLAKQHSKAVLRARLTKWFRPKHCGWYLIGVIDLKTKCDYLGHFHSKKNLKSTMDRLQNGKYLFLTGIVASSVKDPRDVYPEQFSFPATLV